MTRYRLHDDLSFCRIDGRALFLDTGNDRYFRLSCPMARAFDAYLSGAGCTADDIARLVGAGLLTDAPPIADTAPDAIAPVRRSALELPAVRTPHGPGVVAELFAIAGWTQLHLRTRRLKWVLERRVAHRRRRVPPAREESETRLLGGAHAFLGARKYVPLETCCLLDSLSMIAFLARRRLHASLVFGVTGDPFSAHCWVQSGDLALNETVGSARAHTVIRVV